MSGNWPPLDMHAHVEVSITPRELLELRAVVFAATRRLDEAQAALERQENDLLAVWGVGVHPGDASALRDFDGSTFAALAARTAYVSEVGLDGRVKSRLPRQEAVLRSVLTTLQATPRITALHSYAATDQLIGVLADVPIKGVVLHWWLGDAVATQQAVDLGAYFSVNFASLKHGDAIAALPLERILTETDHPDGDRRSPRLRQPGNVAAVESRLAELHGVKPSDIRHTCWSNLRRLVDDTATRSLLPPRVVAIIDAV